MSNAQIAKSVITITNLDTLKTAISFLPGLQIRQGANYKTWYQSKASAPVSTVRQGYKFGFDADFVIYVADNEEAYECGVVRKTVKNNATPEWVLSADTHCDGFGLVEAIGQQPLGCKVLQAYKAAADWRAAKAKGHQTEILLGDDGSIFLAVGEEYTIETPDQSYKVEPGDIVVETVYA